jgi:hypothetical protein
MRDVFLRLENPIESTEELNDILLTFANQVEKLIKQIYSNIK